MEPKSPFKILLFSKTSAYRHESIPAGIACIQRLGVETGLFTVDASEDAAEIASPGLSEYRVVVFLQTSGDFLNAEQLAGLQRYIRNGGSFVGIHCASSGLKGEPWYNELVGAVFTEHPEPQDGVVKVADTNHVIVSMIPRVWQWHDEWYNFRTNPSGKVHVLLTVDENSYIGGKHGDYHPIAWCREFEGARTFYTALGHFDSAYSNDWFVSHILNGILWAARVK